MKRIIKMIEAKTDNAFDVIREILSHPDIAELMFLVTSSGEWDKDQVADRQCEICFNGWADVDQQFDKHGVLQGEDDEDFYPAKAIAETISTDAVQLLGIYSDQLIASRDEPNYSVAYTLTVDGLIIEDVTIIEY